MKSILFCRVSSKEQEAEGYSLPSQEKFLKDYALKKDFEIVKVFSISESASGRYQRKVFNEMMEYVRRHKITIILCEKVDRLTRNLKDAVAINDWIEEDPERQIHFVKTNLVIHKNSSSDEKFRWDIEVVLAKKYITNLSEEVKKGQKEKLAQGWLPVKPPLGYKSTGGKGRITHIVDEVKAPFIIKMYELYSTGNYSLEALAKVMKGEGLRGNKDQPVSKTTMHRLLSNPFYYSKNEWRGKLYDGKQDPLITKELFDKVQEQLTRNPMNRETREFAFTRLMVCGTCGSGISACEKYKKLKNGTVSKYIYYGCTKSKNLHCDNGYIREEDLIKQLVEIIDQIDVNELGIKNKFQDEVKRYNVFQSRVLKIEGKQDNKDIEVKSYIKYLLKEGSMSEKREILSCIKSKVVIRKNVLSIEK